VLGLSSKSRDSVTSHVPARHTIRASSLVDSASEVLFKHQAMLPFILATRALLAISLRYDHKCVLVCISMYTRHYTDMHWYALNIWEGLLHTCKFIQIFLICPAVCPSESIMMYTHTLTCMRIIAVYCVHTHASCYTCSYSLTIIVWPWHWTLH